MIIIEVVGKPVPWQAPKKSGNRFYDPKSHEKESIRWQIKSQYRDQLLSGPLCIDFTFFLPIPKSTSRIKKKQMLAHICVPTSSCDTTNMQKLFEDCLQGIVIENDRLVTDISSRKRYSETPGALIKICSLQEKYGITS